MWLIAVIFSVLFNQQSGVVSSDMTLDGLLNHSGALISNSPSGDSCSLCHYQAIDITTQTNQLCFGCHEETSAKVHKRYHHVDVINDKYPMLTCEGCHKLHNAGASPLLSNDEIDICTSCHPETRQYKSHPVIAYDRGYGPEPLIGSDGKTINCASHCHDLHGTDYTFLCRLEPGRELCISCHKEFE